MTDKEKIIAEIERLKEVFVPTVNVEYQDFSKFLLDFVIDSINSLPAEHPSEELEKVAKEYVKENCILPEDCNDGDNSYYEECTAAVFKDGAQWQKEQMMKGLCYETKVYRDEEGDGIDTPIESWLALENNEIRNLPNIGLEDGDKVKVIIVKEDKQ